MQISATRALYIKLGEGNCWAKLAFSSGVLPFGFHDISHQQALAAVKSNNFQFVKNFYQNVCSVYPGAATRFSNEVREFYTAGDDVLWITFAEGRMWWCFANLAVVPIVSVSAGAGASRHRNTIGGWSDKDLMGGTLWTNALRGSLTTTAGFRGTICRVRGFDYLLRRLNGEETAATRAVGAARSNLIKTIIPLITGLHWKDFELLVELVMTQGGWRRVSATGGTQQTVELELELPLTGERALVQVKAQLNQVTAEKVASDLADAAGGSRIFIVYHTSATELSVDQENVTLIGPKALAEHVIDLGLTTWVMTKTG